MSETSVWMIRGGRILRLCAGISPLIFSGLIVFGVYSYISNHDIRGFSRNEIGLVWFCLLISVVVIVVGVWVIIRPAAPNSDKQPFSEIKERLAMERRRDHTRASLAFALLGLLLVEIVAAIGGSFQFSGADKGMADFNSVINALIGPTVALVGAATGFYFGTRTPNEEHRPQSGTD